MEASVARRIVTDASPYLCGVDPLVPLSFDISQHGPTIRPSVERTAEKAFMLLDQRVV